MKLLAKNLLNLLLHIKSSVLIFFGKKKSVRNFVQKLLIVLRRKMVFAYSMFENVMPRKLVTLLVLYIRVLLCNVEKVNLL